MKNRKINGKEFHLMASHKTKSDADYNASTFRRYKKYVRVTPFIGGYQVWAYGRKD